MLTKMNTINSQKVVLCFLGVMLLLINIYGEFNTLRPHEIHESISDPSKFTEKELYYAINNTEGTRRTVVRQLNEIVNKGISHYWDTTDEIKLNLNVPVWENYILYALSFTGDTRFVNYEFANYKKAIERGLGLCSQQSIILSELLLRRNIPAKIIGLDGHVIVSAEVDENMWWILDPNKGVVIPHSINEVEKNPEIIKVYYKNAGYENLQTMISHYGVEGNVHANEYGVIGFTKRKYVIEYVFYIFKWLLPILFVLPAMLLLHRSNRPPATIN